MPPTSECVIPFANLVSSIKSNGHFQKSARSTTGLQNNYFPAVSREYGNTLRIYTLRIYSLLKMSPH